MNDRASLGLHALAFNDLVLATHFGQSRLPLTFTALPFFNGVTPTRARLILGLNFLLPTNSWSSHGFNQQKSS